MAANIASRDPPVLLRHRQALQQIHILFHVTPHEMIFSTPILKVLDKRHLFVFVDNLLSKLDHEYPTHDTPSPGRWKLMINDIEEDLNKWSPHKLNPDTTISIVSNTDKHLMPIPITPTTGNSWAWVQEVRSFMLPADGVFELQGESHLLLALHLQTKVKISKKHTSTHKTIHNVLVPAEYTPAEVLKLVKAGTVNGIFEESFPDNLRKDKRSVRELGWTHGTVLRLELW